MAEPEILIIDDHDEFRSVFAGYLSSRGYGVATGANGAEALRLLEKLSSVRLIVLDLLMPVMNGFDFLIHRETDKRIRNIPVVVLSALPEEEALPYSWYVRLQKPVDTNTLLATIKRWCGPPRNRSVG